jgi:hypothetical protein
MKKPDLQSAMDALEATMFGPAGCPELPSSGASHGETRWASNPLVLIDEQTRFLESGLSTEQEWAENVVFWIDDALECIARNGEHYRWTIFESSDGHLTSQPDSRIGQLLRDMAKVNVFMAWKPYLEQMRTIAAAGLRPVPTGPSRDAVLN